MRILFATFQLSPTGSLIIRMVALTLAETFFFCVLESPSVDGLNTGAVANEVVNEVELADDDEEGGEARASMKGEVGFIILKMVGLRKWEGSDARKGCAGRSVVDVKADA